VAIGSPATTRAHVERVWALLRDGHDWLANDFATAAAERAAARDAERAAREAERAAAEQERVEAPVEDQAPEDQAPEDQAPEEELSPSTTG
jgi:aromatic-L-amino-acid decarboxylase